MAGSYIAKAFVASLSPTFANYSPTSVSARYSYIYSYIYTFYTNTCS